MGDVVANRLPLEIMRQVLVEQYRLNDDDENIELQPGEAEAIHSLLEFLRFTADEIERDLLRFLRWESNDGVGMTLQQVADELGERYGGRQAVHKRWKNLTAAGRRTTTRDFKHGGAVKPVTSTEV
ncbi:MAG: hypothetical protein AB7H53_19250 [Hyphomicrobium sp.]